MHTGVRKKPLTILRTLPDKARISIVISRTSAYAIIATSATKRINDHSLLSINQSFIDQKLDKPRVEFGCLDMQWRIDNRTIGFVTWL